MLEKKYKINLIAKKLTGQKTLQGRNQPRILAK
jgi:hypothetical protein